MADEKDVKDEAKPKKKAAPRKAAAAEKAPAAPAKAPASKPSVMKKAPEATRAASVEMVNDKNEPVRTLDLHPDVFGVKPNKHLLYEAVKQYRAGARAGTHATKNRALVSGSGKKPWRQKGTGRARVGETRNPLWRHGGTVFGPQPRDYSYALNKKARTAALRSALSQVVKDGGLRVVETINIDIPEKKPYRLTHQLKTLLGSLKIAGKTVIVDHQPADVLRLSGRNMPGVKVLDASQLTVYDVLDCKTLLATQQGLAKLEERLSP